MHWLNYISVLLLPLAAADDASAGIPSPAEITADAVILTEQAEDRLFGRVWKPKVGEPFQIVLSATVDANRNKGPVVPDKYKIFDIDLFDNTKDTIRQLKRSGKKVICYFSAGTSEDWREDFKQIKPKDIGASLPMWPGEKWLDLRSRDVMNLMKKRIRYASQKGCDAVDPDNMDGYENERGGGFNPPLTKRDTIKFMRTLSRYAHLYGMSIGLKNALDVLPELERQVEFAVNEECGSEVEACEEYRKFLNPRFGRGKPVFHIEYVTRTPLYPKLAAFDDNVPGLQEPRRPVGWHIADRQSFRRNQTQPAIRSRLCAMQNPNIGSKMSTVIKVMSLDGWIMDCTGNFWVTRGTPIDKTKKPSRLSRRDLPEEEMPPPDPEWTTILNTPDKAPEPWELSLDAELDRELAASGFNNTSKKRGAAKDRRGPASSSMEQILVS